MQYGTIKLQLLLYQFFLRILNHFTFIIIFELIPTATALHIFLQHSQCELKNQCSTYMYECINKSLSTSNYTLLKLHPPHWRESKSRSKCPTKWLHQIFLTIVYIEHVCPSSFWHWTYSVQNVRPLLILYLERSGRLQQNNHRFMHATCIMLIATFIMLQPT